MNRRALVLLAVGALLVVPTTALGAIVGSPDLSVTVSDNQFTPGEQGTLNVVLVNQGDLQSGSSTNPQLDSQVQTARGLTVDVRSGSAPIDVSTPTQGVGTLPVGATQPIPFRISVNDDAEPGNYRVPVHVEYSYTSYVSEGSGARDTNSTDETFYVTVHIEDQARFRVVGVNSRARVGATGTVAVTVENVGTERASDATVTLTSTSGDVTFGQSASATRYAGTWRQGERRTFEFRARTAPTAAVQGYALQLSTAFEDAQGRPRQSETLSFEMRPDPQQDFTVVDSSGSVPIDGSGTYELTLRNDGPAAVNDTTVTLQSQNADVTFGQSPSATQYVGHWEPGETRTLTFDARASSSAEQRDYALSTAISYEDPEGDPGSVQGLSVGLRPGPEQDFTVVDSSGSVPIDGSGTYELTLRNDGPAAVNDTTVTLQSQSADVTFGQSPTATRYVGHWAPGETRTLTFDARAGPNAERTTYALSTTIDYEDAQGDPGRVQGLSTGLRPAPEQSFSIQGVSSTLRVGDEGQLRGRLVNEGDQPVRNVVLRWAGQSQNVSPTETEYAVGDLAPGESAPFSFSVDVSEGAEQGPRQFSLVAAYRDSEGDQRQSDQFELRQQIAPARDVFDVQAVNTTITAGSGRTIELQVTNAGNQTLSDISAKLFTESPISTTDSEAFVGSLAPGETRTIRFGISADGGALAKDYPLSIDFQYEEPDGDTPTSDTYRLPATVREPESSGGPPLIVIVGAVVVIAGLALVGYRYYQQ
ncbi:MAG: COG1361 S-layer family protein [Haloarculaceae archaeon]